MVPSLLNLTLSLEHADDSMVGVKFETREGAEMFFKRTADSATDLPLD